MKNHFPADTVGKTYGVTLEGAARTNKLPRLHKNR